MAMVAAGAVVAGTAISVYGQMKAAEDQAKMAEFQQKMANEQADELGYRESVNAALRVGEAKKAALDFGAAYAASGKEGMGIGSQLEIMRQVQIQNALSQHDVRFQQAMLRRGGSLYGMQASATREASKWNAAGSLLTGAGSAANIMSSAATSPNRGTPSTLPAPNRGGYNA